MPNALNRSASEKQPQQNNHRDWHTQQPKQNSSSHYRLLIFLVREDNARDSDRFLFSAGFRYLRAFARSRVSEFRRATIRFETASSRSCRRPRALQHSRRRPRGCASSAIRPRTCRKETARPLSPRGGSWDGGRARRISTMPTSDRCSASTATAPLGASARPSATARSNADPASERRPCCRRAVAG